MGLLENLTIKISVAYACTVGLVLIWILKLFGIDENNEITLWTVLIIAPIAIMLMVIAVSIYLIYRGLHG